jgi:hypothetical protein
LFLRDKKTNTTQCAQTARWVAARHGITRVANHAHILINQKNEGIPTLKETSMSFENFTKFVQGLSGSYNSVVIFSNAISTDKNLKHIAFGYCDSETKKWYVIDPYTSAGMKHILAKDYFERRNVLRVNAYEGHPARTIGLKS